MCDQTWRSPFCQSICSILSCNKLFCVFKHPLMQIGTTFWEDHFTGIRSFNSVKVFLLFRLNEWLLVQEFSLGEKMYIHKGVSSKNDIEALNTGKRQIQWPFKNRLNWLKKSCAFLRSNGCETCKQQTHFQDHSMV